MQEPKANNRERYTLYNFVRERFVLPVRVALYQLLRAGLIIFIVALVSNFIFSYFFYTPKMWRLREQNNEIVLKYEILQDKIRDSKAKLDKIKTRDQNVYRAIFSADSADFSSVGQPTNRNLEQLSYGRYSPLMTESYAMLDALARQLYIESMSLDEIEILAVDKDAMTESVPAIWPINRSQVRGNIGAFGSRVDPIFRSIRRHEGIDFAGRLGTPIYATGNGIVAAHRNEHGYGKQILINHGFGYKTRYAHLSSIDVRPGDFVKRGQKIGELGNTGKSTGPHLHYEVILRGTPVNPINYFSRDMSQDDFKHIIQNARSITYETD